MTKYTMLTNLDPDRFYTSRPYLTQWFSDKVVITDNDFEKPERTQQLLEPIPVAQRIVDLTHNPLLDDHAHMIDSACVLTNNFSRWYQTDSRFKFFPIFLWAYSLRKNMWWPDFVFDAGTNKTQGFMCLNNQSRPHRTCLHQLLSESGAVSHITYSMDRSGLPDEPVDPARNDAGVGHSVYARTAVNIVTETVIDQTYISEKTCKPFVAHQIPIIVGGAGTNKFLQDIGLDMFEDVVPWTTWDSETHNHQRLQKIAQFVSNWVKQGTVLDHYQQVLPRIQANKKYFHSEEFRQCIMQQIDNI
jgi:hypothetical protein